MSDTSYTTTANYIRKRNEFFRNESDSLKEGRKSVNEILKNFQILKNDFKNFSSEPEEEYIQYSNTRFDLCTESEQRTFYDDQLQFIETLVTPSLYEKTGRIWNWGSIYKLIYDPEYALVEKEKRKMVFATSDPYGARPIGDQAYMMWNGLQIIDLDIKNQETADTLKGLIFNDLAKYHWFLGITKSASKKSLHVWTKITPISNDIKARRVEYLCNFRHKYSYVYIVLLKYKDIGKYDKEDIVSKFMDMSMCRPQQGTFIPSDNAYLNTTFHDERLDFDFEESINIGTENVNWMFHKDLSDIFQKLEWFNTDQPADSTADVLNRDDIMSKDYDKSKNPKHYKHAQRWQLANTLTSLLGPKKALDVFISICKDTPVRELQGDIKTASIHNKPISKWAVEELNRFHGFNIKVKENQALVEEKIKEIDNAINSTSNEVDPIKIINEKINKINLHITKDQYLSDIKDQIMANLGHITLLESGAGTGKTEMIKAMDKKTLLILPFTSTIKAKVEYSETTKNWLYYYGNKRPTLEELLGTQSMAMTIDKFSRLNVIELDTANFEYIIIDESHLIFTSSYRDVMGPTIQRLANCKSKVIMMSGTPTGEIIFFPNITHIKVDKDDVRDKTFSIFLCNTAEDLMLDMAEDMAETIMNGHKILYPTNKGNLYFEQLTGLVQKQIAKRDPVRKLRKFYYKKSNYGEESMNNINMNKTVGENDIVVCTTYLSVGVDICDADDFEVYFSELFIAQDIEQFANRLRNKNLHIKLFLSKYKADGFMNEFIDTTVKPLDLSIDKEELILARNLVRTCNDMIERNNEESKYSPIVQSLISSNKYIKYDETDAKYYIDETTYKLNVFEDKYSEYAKQIPVLIQAMKEFKYKVNNIVDRDPLVENEDDRTALNLELKAIKDIHYNKETEDTFTFLKHIGDDNIEVYKELLKGNYEIFKSDKYRDYRVENGLYVENIEVLEKNTPIVISLYKFYDCDTIRRIYEFCLDTKKNKINYSKLNRIRRLVIIEFNKQKKRLDFPILKFMKDAFKFAKENPVVTKKERELWVATYATNYANSIRNLVVDSQEYIEEIYRLTDDLWKVVIEESRPVNGMIHINPFDLVWERKDIIDNLYGDVNTHAFLIQDIINNIKTDEIIEEDLPDFEKTEKLTSDDIKEEIPNIIHEEYEYDVYSKKDKSNDRFMRKQENTNRLAAQQVYSHEETQETPTEKSPELDLFPEQ